MSAKLQLLSISPNRFMQFNQQLEQLQINTICNSALCPNRPECFLKYRTVTFLVLGNKCTRTCKYCAVPRGKPEALDPLEPEKVAAAVQALALHYVVITSVARDDLPGGGAQQFADIIRQIKQTSDIPIEVLIPDFNFKKTAIDKIIAARPTVINHNIEAVENCFKRIRPIGNYKRSLQLLQYVKGQAPQISTKSGFMIGVGETKEEIIKTMEDLKHHDVDILTIGQYLPPGKKYYESKKIYSEEEFEELHQYARQLHFKATFIGAKVRSSYHAGEISKIREYI